MASYRIEVTEEAKIDLSHYTAFERKIIVTAMREQLMEQPDFETKNRKLLRENPIASWELRVGKYLGSSMKWISCSISQHCVYRSQGA